jgi:pimeloyl-ACP methyl ester carboxylesterase
VDPERLAEADAAMERLLPRFGVPVARGVVETAGAATHYLESGAGPAVVLLHGGFGGAGNWHRTLGPLARRFRVLAPDRPGHGLTHSPADTDPVAWLDAFLAALGMARVALVGHASGAAVSLAYAQARPVAVRALALSDLALTNPESPGPSPTAGERQVGRRPRRVESWYASLAARFDDRRLLAPEYLYYLWCLAQLRLEQDQRPPGNLAPGPVPLPAPGERTWPARPSLLIWGRGNRWTGVPLARQLHQRIPDAWLRVVEHSKGIPNLEQPSDFNYAAINFLATHVRDE